MVGGEGMIGASFGAFSSCDNIVDHATANHFNKTSQRKDNQADTRDKHNRLFAYVCYKNHHSGHDCEKRENEGPARKFGIFDTKAEHIDTKQTGQRQTATEDNGIQWLEVFGVYAHQYTKNDGGSRSNPIGKNGEPAMMGFALLAVILPLLDKLKDIENSRKDQHYSCDKYDGVKEVCPIMADYQNYAGHQNNYVREDVAEPAWCFLHVIILFGFGKGN